jgi:hypothetical protein
MLPIVLPEMLTEFKKTAFLFKLSGKELLDVFIGRKDYAKDNRYSLPYKQSFVSYSK